MTPAVGWPKCPQCGRDELWSLKPPPYMVAGNGSRGPSRGVVQVAPQPEPTDPMVCLACGWKGVAV